MDSITENEVIAALPPRSANSFLSTYVVDYARQCTDAHLAFHVIGGLNALAQTCPIDLSFPFGMPMFSNIYGLCVGRSSDARKSAAISVARDIIDAAIPGAVGEVPGSKENLVDSLKKNPRQLILYPEFGSFLAATEKGYLTPLKTAYTEAWDGSPLGRGLVKKQDTEAKFPRLSLLAGSTLEYLERHTELADWTGGFMARFIVMYADRDRLWPVPPGDRPKRAEMIAWLQNIATYSHFGVARGQCLGFSSDAMVMWETWYRAVVATSHSTEETAGLVARSHAHALRIALLLAWDFGQARSGHDWYITSNELKYAIGITQLHLRSVRRVGENLSGSKDMRDRRTVLRAIHDTPTPLGGIVKNSRLLLRRTREIIETLLEEGLIERTSSTELAGDHYIRRGARPQVSFDEAGADAPPPMTPEDGGAKVIQLFQPSGVAPASNVNTPAVFVPAAPEVAPPPSPSVFTVDDSATAAAASSAGSGMAGGGMTNGVFILSNATVFGSASGEND